MITAKISSSRGSFKTRFGRCAVAAAVVGTSLAASQLLSQQQAGAAGPAGQFVAIAATSIVNSSSGLGWSGNIQPNQTETVTATGIGAVPSTGVTAVMLDLHSAGNTTSSNVNNGNVWVWAAGATRPDYAVLANGPSGSGGASNTAIVPVSNTGQISFYNGPSSVAVSITANVEGYVTSQTSVSGASFTSLPLQRILNTNDGTGGRSTPLTSSNSYSLDVLGVGGIPSTGVSAVALNVGAQGVSANCWVQTQPTGSASSSSYPRTEAYPSSSAQQMAVVAPGSGGGVTISTSCSSVQIYADVEGYYSTSSDDQAYYVPLQDPQRIVDTRSNQGISGPMTSGRVITGSNAIPVVGVAGVPSNATTVALNLGTPEATVAGYNTIWPDGTSQPTGTSSIDVGRNVNQSNFQFVGVGPNGAIDVSDPSSNTSEQNDIFIDIEGYFASIPPPAVSSSTLHENEANPTSSTSNTFIFNEDADSVASSITSYSYSVDNGSQNSVSGSAPSVAITASASGVHTLLVVAVDSAGHQSPATQYTWYLGGNPSPPSGLSLSSAGRGLYATWTAPSATGGAPITDYDVQIDDQTNGQSQDIGQCGSSCSAVSVTGLNPGDLVWLTVTVETAIGDNSVNASTTVSPSGGATACANSTVCLTGSSQNNSDSAVTLPDDSSCNEAAQSSGNCLGFIVDSGEDPVVQAVQGALASGRIAQARAFASGVEPNSSATVANVLQASIADANSGDIADATNTLSAYNTQQEDAANNQTTANEYSGPYDQDQTGQDTAPRATNGSDVPQNSDANAPASQPHVPTQATHGMPKATSLYAWALKGHTSGEQEDYGYVNITGYHKVLGQIVIQMNANVYFPLRNGDHSSSDSGAFWYSYMKPVSGPGTHWDYESVHLRRDVPNEPDYSEPGHIPCSNSGKVLECQGYSTWGEQQGHFYYFEFYGVMRCGKYPDGIYDEQSRRYYVSSSSSWYFPAYYIGG